MLRLTVERKSRGLTKAKLGALADIHPVEIGRLEAGRIKPYHTWEKRLEEVFEIPANELFEEVNENVENT